MLDEKRWVKLNKFPQSAGSIYGNFEINDVLYVVGSKGISTLNNEVYKFPSNNEYEWCTTCRVGNNIFVFCKEFDDNDIESRLFDPIHRKWSNLDICIKRFGFDVVYYLNKVYIVGGWDEITQPCNSIIIYDPDTEAQTLSPINMNEGRCGHSVIVCNQKLFVFGGIGKDNVLLNSVEMYSAYTNKFVMMAPMNIARFRFGCCRVGHLVYVICGWSQVLYRTNSVEIYNFDNNTWTDGVDLPDDIWYLHAFAVNNKRE